MNVEQELERLRAVYPDPFSAPEAFDRFLAHPDAQRLLGAGPVPLLDFLARTDCPDLARIAVVLLSRAPVDEAYGPVLDRLGTAGSELAPAYEPGLWRFGVPDDQIARDLVAVAERTGSPHPLTILQRPAARAVKPELRAMAGRRELPLSRVALYALMAAPEPADADTLASLAEWTDEPSVAAPAGVALLELGSARGLDGVLAGLDAGDRDLRNLVYYEIARFLPPDPPAYDPEHPVPGAARAVVETLRPSRSGRP